MPTSLGGYVKYFPADKGKFYKDSDAWSALNAGYEITINPDGSIVDVWNPQTNEILDVFGNVIGIRATTYPLPPSVAVESMAFAMLEKNRDRLKGEISQETKQLGVLRNNISGKKRALRQTQSQIKVRQHKFFKPRNPKPLR